MNLNKLLAMRGIHYLVTRFGSQKLRSLAFDEKYRRGDWRFNRDSAGELPTVIGRYLRKGDLLVMGCGGASILSAFRQSEFDSVLGVDLSQEAIQIASRFASSKISFQVSDMEAFAPTRAYDVILFSESIYYVSGERQSALLQRLSKYLKAGGVFIVTIAQVKRYGAILDLIRASFTIREDRRFSESVRHLIVFSPRAPCDGC